MDRNEAIRKETQGQFRYLRQMTRGALAVGKLLLLSAGEVRRFRQTATSEQRYIRPPRRYELPDLGDIQPPSATRKRYLHRTRLCDPRAPEVVECHNVTGTIEYLLRIECADLKSYKTFHTEVLGTQPHVTAITSYVVMGSPTDRRA